MSKAQKIYDGILEAARAVFNQPHVKEFYRKQARAERARSEREYADAAASRLAAEEKRQRERNYDRWALSGGADECSQFGIMSGCQSHCPVLMRGECEQQNEVEAMLKARAGDN